MISKVSLCAIFVVAVLFGCVATSALAGNDMDEHRSCAICGMDRKAYGFSRMMVNYGDGGQVGVCSLHCLVAELDANKGRAVLSLLVADRETRSLVDVTKAVWVMGGKKRGVMTPHPKWAFAAEAAARSFTEANGGVIVTWDEALAAARGEAVPKRR